MTIIDVATGLIPAPTGGTTPHTAQLVTTSVTGILVFVALCYALWAWKTRGTPLYSHRLQDIRTTA